MREKNFLRMLERAIENEWGANEFYQRLKKDAPDESCMNDIELAEEDEAKHYYMFQHLYYQLTDCYHSFDPEFVEYSNFEQGADTARRKTFEAIEMYREMLYIIPSPDAYQPFFIAMTDEMERANRLEKILVRL
ncbi:ferritin-like domain-containing protein [Halobacillus sp. A1]|uniref:ferritin-like domain-containing protein n=1 Tax=Halobacillus sp. A1 TaxID=2880262 RepID=UPI0020A655F9|nr:ferritin-like domain-containing protein [Halobacillus sp. A1]MCP3033275.1 ferritin-like domain-containing protein [Halobacillus sp. A1]